MDERVFEFTRAGDCSHDSRQFSEFSARNLTGLPKRYRLLARVRLQQKVENLLTALPVLGLRIFQIRVDDLERPRERHG